MSRSVLVTGGNRGIGLAIARRLAADGDAVTVTSRSGEKVDELTVARWDGRDAAAVDEGFGQAEAAHGPVEVLVANAGITRDQLLALMSEDDFTAVLETKLTGAYRLARRAVRGMIRLRRGRVELHLAVGAVPPCGGPVDHSRPHAGGDAARPPPPGGPRARGGPGRRRGARVGGWRGGGPACRRCSSGTWLTRASWGRWRSECRVTSTAGTGWCTG